MIFFFQFFRSIDLLPRCSLCLAAVILRITLLTFSLALWITESGHQHVGRELPPRTIQAGKVKQTIEKNWFLDQMGRKNCCWELAATETNCRAWHRIPPASSVLCVSPFPKRVNFKPASLLNHSRKLFYHLQLSELYFAHFYLWQHSLPQMLPSPLFTANSSSLQFPSWLFGFAWVKCILAVSCSISGSKLD